MPKMVEVAVDSTKAWLLYANVGPELESVVLDNHGPNDVTLGDSAVTATHGPTLKTANPPQTILMNGDSIYGRCAGGQTATVEVMVVVSGK